MIAYDRYLKDTLVPEFGRAGNHVTFVDIYPGFIGTGEDGRAIILTT